MFPTASSTIYRNEEGEVLGWSDETYYDAESAYDDFYDDDRYDPYEDDGDEDDWS